MPDSRPGTRSRRLDLKRNVKRRLVSPTWARPQNYLPGCHLVLKLLCRRRPMFALTAKVISRAHHIVILHILFLTYRHAARPCLHSSLANGYATLKETVNRLGRHIRGGVRPVSGFVSRWAVGVSTSATYLFARHGPSLCGCEASFRMREIEVHQQNVKPLRLPYST